jgi:hypothetical protein
MGSDNLETIEHLFKIGSNVEGRGGTHFLHGFVPSRCHVCKERLRRHESKLACCRDPGPRILHITMGEQVQEILLNHL